VESLGGIKKITSILVIIPTYNEVENIVRIIPSIREVLIKNNISYQILVVDDNSPDGTAGEVENMKKEDDQIYLLKRPGKLGLGSAYIDGFTWALSHLPFDIIVQMDADFSHQPSDIVKLVRAIQKNADVAVASRYIESGSSNMWPWHRKLISKIANFLSHIMLGINVKDITSGFRAIRRKTVQELLKYQVNASGYFYQVESLAIYKALDLSIIEVPYVFEARLSGKAKLSIWEIFRFAGFLIKLSLSGVNLKEN
jgi:dolichol-phosphate mannosyltransferase